MAQRQVASVSFSILFEEIWDFTLTFMDWKASKALHTEKESKSTLMNPSVSLKLVSKRALKQSTESQVAKNIRGPPHWALFEDNGGITYRGTYSDLRSEKVLITLWNHQLLGKTLIGSTSVPLKNCLELNFLKTEMVINKPKKRTEENIRDKAQTCGV